MINSGPSVDTCLRRVVLDELMNGRVRSAQGQGELGHHTAGGSSKRTRLVGLLVGAVIAITVVASWVANQPPAPLPATAPADFTVFKEASFPGLNFALVDGTAYYHSSRDTFANLELGGVQHHGASMLALTSALGERDLAELRSAYDATFFTVLGRSISYPNWLVWPLAGLAVVAVAAAALLARRRGRATVPRLLIGSGAALIPLVVAPAAAVGLWSALVAIRLGYGELLMGNPYRPEPFRWALACLTVTVILAWYLLLRRRVGAVALAVGAPARQRSR